MQIDLEEIRFVADDWLPATRSELVTEIMNYAGLESREANEVIEQLLSVHYVRSEHGLIYPA